MKTLTASMIFLMVIAGCKTSSYVVDTKQSQVDYDFEEFDRYMEQRDCTIAFSSGEEEDAKEITSAKDSVSWSTFAKISAPVSQISLVRHSAATGEKQPCSLSMAELPVTKVSPFCDHAATKTVISTS